MVTFSALGAMGTGVTRVRGEFREDTFWPFGGASIVNIHTFTVRWRVHNFDGNLRTW